MKLRLQLAGDKPANATDYFWNRIKVLGPEDCWLWMGAISNHGYGSVLWQGKLCLPHRVAAFLSGKLDSPVWSRSLTDKQLALHTCDTPLCCNPRHLYAGDFKDNSKDKSDRGRERCVRGVEHYCSRFTEEQVREIRARFSQGRGSYSALAKQYGVASNAVRKIILGLSYSHISEDRHAPT